MRCHWTSPFERRRGARSWDRSSKKCFSSSSSNGFLIFDIFFCSSNLLLPPVREREKKRYEMTCPFPPFLSVLFPGRATCRFHIFIRQSRTIHATYKQVGCFIFKSLPFSFLRGYATFFLFRVSPRHPWWLREVTKSPSSTTRKKKGLGCFLS